MPRRQGLAWIEGGRATREGAAVASDDPRFASPSRQCRQDGSRPARSRPPLASAGLLRLGVRSSGPTAAARRCSGRGWRVERCRPVAWRESAVLAGSTDGWRDRRLRLATVVVGASRLDRSATLLVALPQAKAGAMALAALLCPTSWGSATITTREHEQARVPGEQGRGVWGEHLSQPLLPRRPDPSSPHDGRRVTRLAITPVAAGTIARRLSSHHATGRAV